MSETKGNWLDNLRTKAARIIAPPISANVRSYSGTRGLPFTELAMPGGVAVSPFGARGFWPCWGDQDPFIVGHADFDYTTSSLVNAAVQWLAPQLSSPPPKLERITLEGDYENIPESPFLDILARPNKDLSGEDLFSGMAFDWLTDGNVYWYKARDKSGVVRELWPLRARLVKPVSSETEFIAAYDFDESGNEIRYAASDIIHFRNGFDPLDPRRGLPPLRAVLEDLSADRAAATYTLYMLANRGGTPFAVSPKEASPLPKSATSERLKEQIVSALQGPGKFDPLVISIPVDFHDFHYSPEELNVSGVRRTAEARFCAAVRISPMALDLEVGLEHSTYSNKEAAERAAWTDLVTPTLDRIAGKLREQLLTEFYPDNTDLWVGFDYSEVKAMQEDASAVVERVSKAYSTGWMKRSEARAEANLQSGPEDEEYKPAPASPFGAPFEMDEEKVAPAPESKRLDVWDDEELIAYYRALAPERYHGLITAQEAKDERQAETATRPTTTQGSGR